MFMERINSSKSVTLNWNPPRIEEQNGVIISYTINVTEAGNGQLVQRIVPSSETDISISPLFPFTTYLCSIAASTSVNIGPFSTILTFRTPEDSESIRSEIDFIIMVS